MGLKNKFFYRAALAAILLSASIASAQSTVYDNVPNPLPPNLVSEGFECCSTAELGDEIALAGTARVAGYATVVMSSWAKHSTYPSLPTSGFTHPITFTIYASGGSQPGPVLAQVTQSFVIPWRPEHDPSCGGDAWKASNGNCYNGLAATIEFDLRNAGPGGTPLVLPNTFVYGIAYNTNSHGHTPIGVTGPYDSLNVGLSTSAPTVGVNVELDVVFQNADNAYFYSDGGAGGLNVFRKDTNWAPYTPAVSFEAYQVAAVDTDCKKDGWKNVTRADLSSFRNQGDCEQYVKTGK